MQPGWFVYLGADEGLQHRPDSLKAQNIYSLALYGKSLVDFTVTDKTAVGLLL